MTAIDVRPRAGAPPKPGGSPPFGKRLPLLWIRFGPSRARQHASCRSPGKWSLKEGQTQKCCPFLPKKLRHCIALHCAGDGNLRACASASCKARSQLCPTQVARNRLARLWAVPPRASRWWGFLKPGLELRAVFGTRAKHGLISNKCNKHKNYGVFL